MPQSKGVHSAVCSIPFHQGVSCWCWSWHLSFCLYLWRLHEVALPVCLQELRERVLQTQSLSVFTIWYRAMARFQALSLQTVCATRWGVR